jgi:hypothetical protein
MILRSNIASSFAGWIAKLFGFDIEGIAGRIVDSLSEDEVYAELHYGRD